VIEVVLESGFVAFLAETVDALAKDFLLYSFARAGYEEMTVGAADGLKVVRVAVTGAVGGNEEQ